MSASKAVLKPKLLAFVFGFLVLWGGAVSWSWSQHSRWEKSERGWEIKQREWGAMRSSTPSPLGEVVAELEKEVEVTQRKLGELREALNGGRTDLIRAAAVPAQRADAFFAIAQFVEAQRQRAQTANVTVAEGTHFGFSDFANSGPATEYLGVVNRQQLVMERLLDSLWVARPLRLTRSQREMPRLADGEPNQRRISSRNNDYVEVASARTLKRDGVVDTLTFRIGFVGKTHTLRRFLRSLAEQDVALVVRGIEVEPITADGRSTGGVRSLADLFRDDEVTAEGAAATPATAVPIIRANESEFSVTVDYLDFEGGKLLRARDDEEGRP